MWFKLKRNKIAHVGGGKNSFFAYYWMCVGLRGQLLCEGYWCPECAQKAQRAEENNYYPFLCCSHSKNLFWLFYFVLFGLKQEIKKATWPVAKVLGFYVQAGFGAQSFKFTCQPAWRKIRISSSRSLFVHHFQTSNNYPWYLGIKRVIAVK